VTGTAEPGSEARSQHEPVFALLRRLVAVLLAGSYEGTFRAEQIVQRVARSYGADVEVAFNADSAALTVGERTATFAAVPLVPPLDQVSDFRSLIYDIEDGRLTASQAHERLDALTRRPPRFSKAWQVVGLCLFATGFGVSVQATGQEIAASAVLGLLVGLIAVASQDRPRLTIVAPFVASVVVSTITLIAYKHGWIDGGPIQLMVPCLFFFIPGDAISAAMLELADGRITAGATRLIFSVALLLVLAFGALVATVIVNVPERFLFDVEVKDTLGFWVAWGGWVVFAVGCMLTFSMRPADFPWALGLILLTAAAAQLGTKASGEVVGNFVGAVVMTATALLLARSRRRPPAYVLYLGAFYVLTPGSHGLRGFETWLGGHPIEGFKGVGDMVALFTALAVGMLVAAAAVRPERSERVGGPDSRSERDDTHHGHRLHHAGHEGL
jgi:uncharacterized membrane protein YjjP (DUF1212 family)